jgi:hypothetical protein
MSIKIQSRVWETSKQSGGSLLVLLALADFANDDGYSFPSVGTLARKSRLTERQVQRVLSKLVGDGELLVFPKSGAKQQGDGGGFTNQYKIIFKTEGCNNVTPDKGGVTFKTERGDITGGRGVTPMSPKPSGEPSGEPSISFVDSIDECDSYQMPENEMQVVSIQAPLYPDTKTSIPKGRPATAKDLKDFSLLFDEKVWALYPKKSSGKAAAFTMCGKLDLDQWATLLSTIDTWNSHWREMEAGGDLQFVPGLAKWVKDGRYESLPTMRVRVFTKGARNQPPSSFGHIEDPSYPYSDKPSQVELDERERAERVYDERKQALLRKYAPELAQPVDDSIDPFDLTQPRRFKRGG